MSSPVEFFSRVLHGQDFWEAEGFWRFPGYRGPRLVALNFDPSAPTPVPAGPAGMNMDFGLPDPVHLVSLASEPPWKGQPVPTAKATTQCKARPSSKAAAWMRLKINLLQLEKDISYDFGMSIHM